MNTQPIFSDMVAEGMRIVTSTGVMRVAKTDTILGTPVAISKTGERLILSDQTVEIIK